MGQSSLSEERSGLGRFLLERGALTPDWADAFTAVPRHGFLPDVIWPYDMDTNTSVEVDRRKDPQKWQRYVQQDIPIVTQWDDGAATGAGRESTSSASMPSVVVRMLADLEIRPRDRVLEIGTGTGWNAALLAQRLGTEQVVTIEVDARVAQDARRRLAAHGLLGTVLTRDGARGDPQGAPYDRLIATAGLRRIPAVWLGQVRLGGLIVAPWGTDYTNADAVVRLEVADDGAHGHFTRAVEFMKLRAQRRAFDGHAAYVPQGPNGADRSTTKVTEDELLGEGRFDPRTFAIGLRVADCYQVAAAKRAGDRPVWLYGLKDRSWACVMFHQDGETDVWQSGPRRLWDEVEGALRWWQEAGEPGYERLGLSVILTGEHRAWLDSPEDSWPV